MRYIRTRNFDYFAGTCEVRFLRLHGNGRWHKSKWFTVHQHSKNSRLVAYILQKYKPFHVYSRRPSSYNWENYDEYAYKEELVINENFRQS